MWNVKDLPSPPISTARILNTKGNLSEIRSVINDTVNIFSDQLYFKTEADNFYKFLRHRKISYRRQPSWKFIEKLNKALCVYQELNFGGLLYMFFDSIPLNYRNEDYFPSRNMLDYVLVRTQGLGKLLCRIYECASEVFNDGIITINRGHNFAFSILSLSISARIIIISRFILQKICIFYEQILPWRHHLGNSKMEWLSPGYEFPKSLRNWLDSEWAFVDIDFVAKLSEPKKLFNAVNPEEVFEVEDEDVEFIKQYFDLTVETNSLVEPVTVKAELENLTESVMEVLADHGTTKDSVEEIVTGHSSSTSNVIDVGIEEEEIGIPLNKNLRITEVRKALFPLKTLKTLTNFIKSSSYFKHLSSNCYQDILTAINVFTVESNHKTKEYKDELGRLKEKIILIAFSGDEPE